MSRGGAGADAVGGSGDAAQQAGLAPPPGPLQGAILIIAIIILLLFIQK